MEEEKLHELFNDMSLKEKVGQLIQLSGDFFDAQNISFGPHDDLGISQEMIDLTGSVLNVTGAKDTKHIQDIAMKKQPHHIPLMFMADIIYGYKTILPSPLGLGSTWNPELVKKGFENAGKEAYASGNHVAFAPMVDVAKDARWGRVLESPGEDSLVNSRMAKAMVEGFQKDFDKKKGQAACVKHYAAYGAVESGKEYNTVDMSISNLFQNYMMPYKAAVDAGAKMVMSSLNSLNGIPTSADKWLIKDILRDKWKFKGVTISDYASIQEIIDHGYARNNSDAAKKAIEAGEEIDMKSPVYATELVKLVEDGIVDSKLVDDACWHVLKLKNELGLFEDPYRGAAIQKELKEVMSPEKRELSRKLAEEAIVLLKNKNSVLPLNKKEKYALIGPFAKEKSLIGMWAVLGEEDKVVSLDEGLKNKNINFEVAKGTDILRDKKLVDSMGFFSKFNPVHISSESEEKENLEKAITLAKKVNTVILALGEHKIESGEGGSKTNLHLARNQLNLLNEIHKLGKKIILVIFGGRPFVLTDVEDKVDAIVEAWYPGTEGGNALANILCGDVNPSGKLSMTFPYSEAQEPIYYSHLSTGRPSKNPQKDGRFVSRYIDAPGEPLYPFGFGLHYGEFEYKNIRTEKQEYSIDEKISIKVDITNKGDMESFETVQLYMNDPVASIVQPVKRLIDFKKVHFKIHETKTIEFIVNSKSLEYFDNFGQEIFEPGVFNLYIGPNSRDLMKQEIIYK